jgi:fumarate reductase subunit D
VLLALCVLALFHWAQRFRYTLIDGLQLKRHSDVINFVCYGLAAAGSVVAADLLVWAL